MAEGMIERAARALFMAGSRPSSFPDIDFKRIAYNEWERCEPEAKAGYIADARAIFQTIREPTGVMIVDATDYEAVDGHATSRNVWRAMIDAALAETATN